MVRPLTNSCHSERAAASRACSSQPQVVAERAVAGLAQPARQPAVDHGLLAGVQADAGVLVDQVAHALEVLRRERELLLQARIRSGRAAVAQNGWHGVSATVAGGILPSRECLRGSRWTAFRRSFRAAEHAGAAARLAVSILSGTSTWTTRHVDPHASAKPPRPADAALSRGRCNPEIALQLLQQSGHGAAARRAAERRLAAGADRRAGRPVQPRRAHRPGQPAQLRAGAGARDRPRGAQRASRRCC